MILFCIYFCVKLGLLQLYPTYISYKAIKVNNEKEYHSLMIFWIVSITYLSLEYVADIFLFWLPFYTELKLFIVLWLILPQTQGAYVFYSHYLDPFLHQHQAYIDKSLLDVQEKLKETIVLYGKHLVELIKESISEMIFKEDKEKSIQPKNIEPEQNEVPMGPYHLLSSLVAATASKIQQQEPELHRTDSQESLQSYVDIHGMATTPLTWGEYLSSWVKKPAATAATEEKE